MNSNLNLIYDLWYLNQTMTPTALFPVSFFTRAWQPNRPSILERSVNIKFTTWILWQFFIKCKNEKNCQMDKHQKFHYQLTKCFYLQNWMNDSLRNLLTHAFFSSTQPVCIVAMFQQLWVCYYFRMNSTFLYIDSVICFQFMFELSWFDFM